MNTRVWSQTDAEVLDYSIDWSAALASDFIVSSKWELSPVESGTIDTVTNDQTEATVWLSELSGDVLATNRVSTAGGRTHERTLVVRLAEMR